MEEQEKHAVDDESVTQQNHPDPLPAMTPRKAEPKSTAPQQPPTAQQLKEVEEKMSAFERSTLRWAKAAVIMSALAAAFACLQWREMHAGSVDTHNLAVAASSQAIEMRQLENSAVQANRAWMVPKGYSSTVVPINLFWQNAGKSPAINVWATAQYDFAMPSRLRGGCPALKSNKWKVTASIVDPGEPFVVTLNDVPQEWQSSMPDQSTRLLNIHGCVWYTDVLTSTQRTTEFWLGATRIRSEEWARRRRKEGKNFPEVNITPSGWTQTPFVFR